MSTSCRGLNSTELTLGDTALQSYGLQDFGRQPFYGRWLRTPIYSRSVEYDINPYFKTKKPSVLEEDFVHNQSAAANVGIQALLMKHGD